MEYSVLVVTTKQMNSYQNHPNADPSLPMSATRIDPYIELIEGFEMSIGFP